MDRISKPNQNQPLIKEKESTATSLARSVKWYTLITGIVSAASVIWLVGFYTSATNVVIPVKGAPASTEIAAVPIVINLLIAYLAGVMGSFIHGGQSFSSYIGNGTFKVSWGCWYLYRPWIGGALGLILVLVFSAQFFGNSSSMELTPLRAAALGGLGGWFSKITADKMQEILQVLLASRLDLARKDKLKDGDRTPAISNINPAVIPSGAKQLIINGRDFLESARVQISGNLLDLKFIQYKTDTELVVTVADWADDFRDGTPKLVQVVNPAGDPPVSGVMEIRFEKP